MRLFQDLGKKLGLELHASERVELGSIDKNTQKLPSELVQERRAMTIEAYTLIQEKKNALVLAQGLNGTQDNWLAALRFANDVDKIMPRLLIHKLNDMLIGEWDLRDCLSLGYFINVTALSFIFTCVSMRLLINYGVMEEKNAKFVFQLFLSLFGSAFALSNVLRVAGGSVISLLRSSHVNDVIEAAKIANVIIDLSKASSIPVQKRNYSELLEKMGVSKVPEEYLCSINWQIMDSPVFCAHHRARYDEKSINDWLKVKNEHPLTREPLYRDELIRDLPLKQKIDFFVEQEIDGFYKTREYIDHQILTPLIKQSLFRQQLLVESKTALLPDFSVSDVKDSLY